MSGIELMNTRPCKPQVGNVSDLDPSWLDIPVVDCSQWPDPEVTIDFTIFDAE